MATASRRRSAGDSTMRATASTRTASGAWQASGIPARGRVRRLSGTARPSTRPRKAATAAREKPRRTATPRARRKCRTSAPAAPRAGAEPIAPDARASATARRKHSPAPPRPAPPHQPRERVFSFENSMREILAALPNIADTASVHKKRAHFFPCTLQKPSYRQSKMHEQKMRPNGRIFTQHAALD